MAETAAPATGTTDTTTRGAGDGTADNGGEAPPPPPARGDGSGRRAPVAPRPVRAPRPHEPLWRHVLGGRFRFLRHERGETLVETAGRAGVSPQYLSEVERGIKEPSSEMIAALAGALDVTLGDLALAVAETLSSTRSAPRTPTCHAAAYALAA
ncbi:helix-turn-helix domain-containing protein [Yinghuangia sp. ASG 101]|uniref:helix-turn-helix domain-containing protein n=1 Tax=Yinghuangia sp. ASG 101 TaxID=2896848 RepID=UPI001E5543C5|nr:helix-turn-helix transcriptional regulator [Yinghuangia sp. ASG 101]UGQ12192.1 helix-turn-helix domain-containing protein [Yinghuangia sp. ASG 101]